MWKEDFSLLAGQCLDDAKVLRIKFVDICGDVWHKRLLRKVIGKHIRLAMELMYRGESDRYMRINI